MDKYAPLNWWMWLALCKWFEWSRSLQKRHYYSPFTQREKKNHWGKWRCAVENLFSFYFLIQHICSTKQTASYVGSKWNVWESMIVNYLVCSYPFTIVYKLCIDKKQQKATFCYYLWRYAHTQVPPHQFLVAVKQSVTNWGWGVWARLRIIYACRDIWVWYLTLWTPSCLHRPLGFALWS